MSSEETKSRGKTAARYLVPAGVVAAMAGAALVTAGAANAATATVPLTASLTGPTTIVNDGSSAASQTLSLKVTNSDPAATASGTAQINVTKPAGLACNNIVLTAGTPTPDGTAPVFTPLVGVNTGTTCALANPAAFSQAGNSSDTYPYSVSVLGTGITGTISFQVVLTQSVNLQNGNVSTSTTTTNTVSSSLVAPAANTAPVLSSATPPVPVVYQPYSFQVVTSQGIPAATYSVFKAPVQPDPETNRYAAGTLETTTDTTVTNPTTGAADPAYNLGNGFAFDTVTGKITDSNASASQQDSVIPPSSTQYRWTIIANNGQGGAATASAGTVGGVAQPTAPVALHDVQSQPFYSLRVFSDVALDSQFGPQIYQLVQQSIITGFVDGTFRGTQSVTRQAFAAIRV